MALDRRSFIKQAGSILAANSALPSLSLAKAEMMEQSLAKKIQGISGKIRRSITVLYPKGCLGNLEPVKSRFTDLTGISVNLREASLDDIASEMHLSKRIKSEASKFDVAIPPTFALPDLIEAGVIANLTNMAKKHEPRDFRRSYVYSLGDEYLGKLYGYQTDGDAYLLFLKKSWLENPKEKLAYRKKYGVELAIPKTWEELDRQIRFFHRPKENRYGGNLFRNRNYLLWEFWIRMHAKGVLPFDAKMNARINAPESVRALEELVATSSFLDPSAKSDGLFDNFKAYAKGNSYCNLGWGGTQKYLNGPQSDIKDDLIFASPPGGKFAGKISTIPYFNWGWNYVVSNDSTQKELAYLFCLFANTPNISVLAVRESSGYFDPYRVEHYKDPAIENTYGRDFLDAHQDALTRSIPDLYLRGQGLYLSALKQALHSTNQGQIDAPMALEAVASKWNEITKKLGRSNQLKQWQALLASYPKHMRDRHG